MAEAASDGTQSGTGDIQQAADAKPADTTKAGKEEVFTRAQLESHTSAAINEARKKWKQDFDSTVADKTRDAESKLAELSSKAAEAERRASFLEEAAKAQIRNPSAAYLVAKGGGYLDEKGAFDAKRFRTDNPEFFTPQAQANAGNGAGGANNAAASMDTWLRRQAGRAQ